MYPNILSMHFIYVCSLVLFYILVLQVPFFLVDLQGSQEASVTPVGFILKRWFPRLGHVGTIIRTSCISPKILINPHWRSHTKSSSKSHQILLKSHQKCHQKPSKSCKASMSIPISILDPRRSLFKALPDERWEALQVRHGFSRKNLRWKDRDQPWLDDYGIIMG